MRRRRYKRLDLEIARLTREQPVGVFSTPLTRENIERAEAYLDRRIFGDVRLLTDENLEPGEWRAYAFDGEAL